MPRSSIGIRSEGNAALKELNARLKAADRVDLARNMRKQINKAGQPVVAEIRAAAMNVRVTSSRGGQGRPKRSTGLRARVAAATGISQTQKGIRIKVSATRVDPKYGVTLPRYLDASLSPRWARWRHPVFWAGPIGTAPAKRVVQQKGSPYFVTTILKHREEFRRAIGQAAEETVKELLG